MDSNLIYKYLSGELDENQVKKLFKWVKSSENNRKFFAEIKNSWVGAKVQQEKPEVDLLHDFELLTIRLNQKKKPKKSVLRIKNPKKSGSSIGLWLVRIAAVFLLLYSLGGTAYYLYNSGQSAYNVISTKRGEKSHLVLSDGTKIWLNSETTLKYPVNFKRKNVNVFLEGEAYFEVSRNKSRKFIVNASTLNITVLGTSFNVKSYSDERMVETTLEKGKISITGTGGEKALSKTVVLRPNQRATFIKNSDKIFVSDIPEESKEKALINIFKKPGDVHATKKPNLILSYRENTKLYTSWKDGQLVFKSERFEDLARRMERWYDINIEIKSQELKDSKYTGIFEKETIEQALKALSLSLPFKYEIDKNLIIINKNE